MVGSQDDNDLRERERERERDITLLIIIMLAVIINSDNATDRNRINKQTRERDV